jgi:hypothetical protein
MLVQISEAESFNGIYQNNRVYQNDSQIRFSTNIPWLLAHVFSASLTTFVANLIKQ